MTRGQHMRKARKAKGLTLREMSELTGLSYNGISQLELDKRDGSIVTIEMLADALGLSIDEYTGHQVKEESNERPVEL